MNFSDETIATESRERRKLGLVAVGVTGAVAIGLSIVSAPFVTPALRRFCLPYVPATSRQVDNVVKMCKHHQSRSKNVEKLIDLGSGDGRIVIAAAKNGFACTGVELNLWLVLYSKIAAGLLGLRRNATFQRLDLWKTDLSEYDKIVIFGVAEMMPTLRDKLLKEMKKESKVVACRFPIPKWKPIDMIDQGIDSVWVYSPQHSPSVK